MFISTLDHTSLSIIEEDFVRYIRLKPSIHLLVIHSFITLKFLAHSTIY